MTTAAPSTALATIQPAFADPERLALGGYLAGYRGLTREACALDLRQFASWYRARCLGLFAVRRADIESFARDLETRGRARATVTRPLCIIAGFYKYAVVRRGTRAPDADDHPQGGKVVTVPLAPRTARAVDLAIRGRTEGAGVPGRGRAAAGPARRRAGRPQGRPSR